MRQARETSCAILRAAFETCERGVLNEVRLVGSLFEDGKRAA